MKIIKSFILAASVSLAMTQTVVFAQQEQSDSIKQLQQQLQQMQLQLELKETQMKLQQLEQQMQRQQPQQEQESIAPKETPSLELRAKVDELLKGGLRKNKETIKRESANLSEDDVKLLYNDHRKKGYALWAMLDFFPGFGLGSYLQGDIIFGIAQSTIDVTGILFMRNALISRGPTKDAVFGSGLAMIITSRIASFIFPLVYQSNYNNNLEKSLNYNKFAYSLDPLIVPRQGGGAPALGLGFNVRY
jgi:hypothetical protein